MTTTQNATACAAARAFFEVAHSAFDSVADGQREGGRNVGGDPFPEDTTVRASNMQVNISHAWLSATHAVFFVRSQSSARAFPDSGRESILGTLGETNACRGLR